MHARRGEGGPCSDAGRGARVFAEAKSDGNSYTFGRIGEHNIVIACFPAGVTGNNSAATVANDMRRTFPIMIRLMVAVGGGV
jgi:hypothetical protein